MTRSNANRCILLFAKYPEKGTVKTRLAADLNGVSAEEIYQAFVLDTLCLLERAAVPFIICCYPHDAQARFSGWLGAGHTFVPQYGQDLGERMLSCFRHAFSQGFQRVIALGTDSPDLPGSIMNDAFSSLESHDAVIGPCEDGGYYLIGFRKNRFLPDVFTGISWSTDQVFSQTVTGLKKSDRQTHILGVWNDVDTLDDLKALYTRGRTSAFQTSRTMALLARHADIIPFATQPLQPPT